jgi:hypothetical protein
MDTSSLPSPTVAAVAYASSFGGTFSGLIRGVVPSGISGPAELRALRAPSEAE